MTNRKIMVTESSYQGETLRLVSASQKQQEEKGKHCWSAKVERQIVTWKPTPHETQKGKQYVLIKPKTKFGLLRDIHSSLLRTEERPVGKEVRSRWSPYQ